MESNIELEISQLNAELLRLKSEIVSFENTRKSEVQMLKDRVLDAGSLLGSKNFISQIEGRRYPKWYSVEIPFSYGGSTPKSSSVEITTRPFVCTQMSSLYYITDEDPSHFAGVGSFFQPYSTSEITCDGRSLPTTAYFATITSMLYDWNVRKMSKPSVNIIEYSSFVIGEVFSNYFDGANDIRNVGWNYPDFDFEIRIANSGRRWTDDKIPAAAFYSANGNPLFLGHNGFIDAYDRIEVTAHPTIETINTQGIVKFVFFGYEIETTQNLSDVFGY